MVYALYRWLTGAAAPLIERRLRARLSHGKEEAARIDERRGTPSRARPPGLLVWLHGASVGESQSLLPLIEALGRRLPQAHFLVTTGTVTSAGLMARRLGPRAFHQYAPLDAPRWVARFFDHWKPQLGLMVESELWPNLIEAAAKRGAVLALLNARMSERSAARWRALRPLARRMLGRFALVGAQSTADAARFASLGAADVRTFGNLKYAGATLPVDADAAQALRAAIGPRPAILFASTHEGEEALAVRVHRALSATIPALLTVIAPRHPERGGAILETLAREKFRASLRSAGKLPGEGQAFYVADTLGELGTLFAAVKIVVMGGSFVAIGGHNPLEPAAAGCAVLCGPHMENFADIAARMEGQGALVRCADESEATSHLAALLEDAAAVAAHGARGRASVAAETRVLAETIEALEPLIARAEARGRP
jgi:3-deoxy-D-manno-octulosonic-acid transferase